MLTEFNIGDIVIFKNERHWPKRVVFCKRLNCRALQNSLSELENPENFGKFDNENIKGIHASTFVPPCGLKLTKIDFQSLEM